MQDHLNRLKGAAKALVPMPPAASKPGGRRPVGGISALKEFKDVEEKCLADGGPTFRELRELNSSLSAENTRLNTELSRLLSRAAQHRGPAGVHKA